MQPQFQNKQPHEIPFTEIQSNLDLLQKELSVNREEQNLLKQRIEMMRAFANDLPSYDPHYSGLLAQVQMDQIEVDELKMREALLIQKIEETNKG